MKTSIGRVAILHRGTYSAETQYAVLDEVYYNGSTYRAKSNTIGNLPTNTTYWNPVASVANLQADFANMASTTLADVEAEYAPELAAVHSELADTTQLYQSTIDTILAGDVENANTAQLILAAGTDANLPARLTRHESRTSALETVAIGLSDIASWDDVQRLVQQGLGPKAFPVGTQLKTQHADYGEILWDVVAHENHKKPGDDNAHTMSLLMSRVINGRQVDAPEALYYCETELAAGTYNFALMAGYDTAYGGGKSYQFTTTQPVPVGGQIMFPWGYNVQAMTVKISTFATSTATTPIESNIAVTEGTGGINLGTADGSTPNMNHLHRLRYGSNNYRESAVRQWLNSDAANAWWVPTNKFDRPATYSNVAGFLNGMESEFVDAVGAVDITTIKNTLYEIDGVTGGSYVTRDKFFLPSMTEIGLGKNNSIDEGSTLPFYTGADQIDRIKYDYATPSTARYWLLRSPRPSDAYGVRDVLQNGSLFGTGADDGRGAVAECVIY